MFAKYSGPSKFALVPAMALIALLAWSFASPVGASPDDDFHLASSWCALGDREGLCESTGNPSTRMIPLELNASACYAFKSDDSAECQAEYRQYDENGAPFLVERNRGNFQGSYPPVYYFVTGLLASPNLEVSALAMRVLVSVLFVAIVTALFLLLPERRRARFGLGWLVSVVPLGVFVIASNNPSGWAVLSAGTLWLAMVGFFEGSGKVRVGLGIVTILALIMGAGARADAAVFCALGAVVAVVLTVERTRAYLRLIWLPVLVVLVSIAFYFSSSQGASAASGMAAVDESNGPFTVFAYNVINLPLLWAGSFGAGNTGALGWLDTQMPGIVWVGAFSSFAVIAFAGLRHLTKRKAIALGFVTIALVAVPLYVLQTSNSLVGANVQARYLLPLLVMLVGVALFQADVRPMHFSLVQRYLVASALAVAQSLALHFNMRRYITGLDVGSFNLNSGVEWWWDGFVPPMVVWAVGTVAFGVLAFMLVELGAPAMARTAGSSRVAEGSLSTAGDEVLRVR